MVKVFCFGNTSNGELGLGGIEDEHILLPRKQKLSIDCRKYSLIQLSSGRNHTLVLFRNHSEDSSIVLSCGSNERNQLGREGSWKRLEPIDALHNHIVIKICCGANHSLALTEAGQMFGWGCNLFGQLGIGNSMEESVRKPSLVKRLAAETVVQISCGGNHNLALTKNGLLYSWGSNAFGQLGIGTKGNIEYTPIEVINLRSVPIRQLSCGGSHSAILSYTGGIYMWGKNEFGQLGLSDTDNRSVPTVQTTLRSQRISFIDCGEEHSVALTIEGGLFTWGAGMYGQLGHSKNNNELLPRRVFELMGSVVTQVSCGRCHTLATVGPKGRVYAFGLNGSGQLGIGTQISKSVPISVRGQWVELGIKDVSLRNMAGYLLPVIKDNTSPNASNRNSPSRRSRTRSPPSDEEMRKYGSDMSIDELSDCSDDPSEVTSTDETVIIEEPEDRENRVQRKPSFVCTSNTIVSTEPDSIQIDEYQSDPDSDCELTTERQTLVLKLIVASKGDQSFVLVDRLSDKSNPLDLRFDNTFEEIYKLDNKRFERFSDTAEDQTVDIDDIDYIENALTSISCWNSSYIDYDPKTDAVLPSIDWKSAKMGFGLIESSKNSRIKELVFQSILRIIPDLPNILDQNSLDPEVLRIYLLLPLFHSFRTEYTNKEVMNKLIGGYIRAVLRLNDYAKEELKLWWSQLEDKSFKDLILVIKSCIVELLNIQDNENQTNASQNQNDSDQRLIDSTLHKNLGLCLDFMALLHEINKKYNKISYKVFYIEGISDKFDLKMDYIHWLTSRARNINQIIAGSGRKVLYLCDFPFIFDPPAKTLILATDSAIQQQNAAENALYRSLLPIHVLTGYRPNPYFCLTVSRDSIVEDTINALCLQNQNPSEFKKPLRLEFRGEEAIDAGFGSEGGMKKEFFLLLMKEFLSPDYGLFVEYKETNTIWFNPGDIAESRDLVVYHLIGIVCGLAIYNQIIIYLPFPLVLYKKLLDESLVLEDLNSLDPILTKNLKDIIETPFSEEEFNAIHSDINFMITLTCFGSAVEFELEKNGKNKTLNYNNREEYVRLYWNYILNVSIERHFDSFKKGFNKVLDTGILELFRAEELMQLITGQEVYDWNALETSTNYKEPFSKSHPTIVKFWKVFHSLTIEQKKMFLLFLTGSDRIPILGMKALKLIIQPMKVSEEHLPVAHTCFNLLDLPEVYSSEDKLSQKLLKAIENTNYFALA